MKYLNKRNTKLFNELRKGLNDENRSRKIENGAAMPLSIEYLHEVKTDGLSGKVYSFTHYGEQNGDLMADPDMTFLSVEGGLYIIPLSYRNDYGGCNHEAVFIKDGSVQFSPRLQADHTKFANLWFNNIRNSGYLKAMDLQTA